MPHHKIQYVILLCKCCLCLHNENICDLFVWDDEIGYCMNVNTNILASCKNCEMENVELEITTNKLEKAKIKIDVHKKKYFNLKMRIVISWFMFAMF